MKVNDRIRTPRCGMVLIREIFEDVHEAQVAGYTEPTGYRDGSYEVVGRLVDEYHMRFAAFKR